jgi:shikimate 5-dehydrogenase
MGANSVVGGSVTIPLKQYVVRLCTTLSPAASRIGCVNTLSLQPCPSGGARIAGDNTDWAGMLACLTRVIQLCGGSQPITCAVIVGSGATARSAAFALLHLPNIAATYICNRTRASSTALATELNVGSFGLDDEVAPVGMQGRSVIIISTVSLCACWEHPAVAPLLVYRLLCRRPSTICRLTPVQQGPSFRCPIFAQLALQVCCRLVRLRLC